jgi:hypothetical protein
MMISTFLDESYANPQNSIVIQNQLSRFMSDDSDANFNETLRKDLILGSKNQDLLESLFELVLRPTKEFSKSIQEKAIYKRNSESLSNIVNLANLQLKKGIRKHTILNFVLANTKDLDLLVQAHAYLIRIKIENAEEKDFTNINAEIEGLLTEYEISPFTLSLQLIQAHFVAFNLKPEQGRAIKKALDLRLDDKVAQVKMELADILLFEKNSIRHLLFSD